MDRTNFDLEDFLDVPHQVIDYGEAPEDWVSGINKIGKEYQQPQTSAMRPKKKVSTFVKKTKEREKCALQNNDVFERLSKNEPRKPKRSRTDSNISLLKETQRRTPTSLLITNKRRRESSLKETSRKSSRSYIRVLHDKQDNLLGQEVMLGYFKAKLQNSGKKIKAKKTKIKAKSRSQKCRRELPNKQIPEKMLTEIDSIQPLAIKRPKTHRPLKLLMKVEDSKSAIPKKVKNTPRVSATCKTCAQALYLGYSSKYCSEHGKRVINMNNSELPKRFKRS